MTCLWNNLHQVQSKSKDWNNFKINKTKGTKQDSQNVGYYNVKDSRLECDSILLFCTNT